MLRKVRKVTQGMQTPLDWLAATAQGFPLRTQVCLILPYIPLPGLTESSFLIVLISNSDRFSWIPGSEPIHLDLEKLCLLSY